MKKAIVLVISVLCIMSLAVGCSAKEMENTGSDIQSSVNSAEDKIESGINDITDNDSSMGSDSSMEKISKDEAKKIALKHANLTDKDISDLEIELENDNGVPTYEVTFDTKTDEYDYHIDAATGKIVSSKKEKRD
ncbi:MAG: PepSY domain-containing protein [Acutalibacteraceae bacterium]|nr:PepSY domain-containing protein [Acutalibacteraceae bacterium]